MAHPSKLELQRGPVLRDGDRRPLHRRPVRTVMLQRGPVLRDGDRRNNAMIIGARNAALQRGPVLRGGDRMPMCATFEREEPSFNGAPSSVTGIDPQQRA